MIAQVREHFFARFFDRRVNGCARGDRVTTATERAADFGGVEFRLRAEADLRLSVPRFAENHCDAHTFDVAQIVDETIGVFAQRAGRAKGACQNAGPPALRASG